MTQLWAWVEGAPKFCVMEDKLVSQKRIRYTFQQLLALRNHHTRPKTLENVSEINVQWR